LLNRSGDLKSIITSKEMRREQKVKLIQGARWNLRAKQRGLEGFFIVKGKYRTQNDSS
jgi:hypothetical protein